MGSTAGSLEPGRVAVLTRLWVFAYNAELLEVFELQDSVLQERSIILEGYPIYPPPGYYKCHKDSKD